MSTLDPAPEYGRRKLLPIYTDLMVRRAREGVFGDLEIRVEHREYLQIMYETQLSRGLAASGNTLVWAPWPGEPQEDLPVCVEIRLSHGRLVFREHSAREQSEPSSPSDPETPQEQK